MDINLGDKIGNINVDHYATYYKADFMAKFKGLYPEGLLEQAYKKLPKKKKIARHISNSK